MYHVHVNVALYMNTNHSPGKFVLGENQYFTLQYAHYLFLIVQPAMLQHMLDNIVSILVLQEQLNTRHLLYTYFITWINLSVEACSSIRMGSVCSAVQFSRIRCITLQPYGCVAKSNTWLQKALMMNCSWLGLTHSTHF